MHSTNNQYYKSSSIPSNANNRWGQQQQQAVATNVNNAHLSDILSFVGGVQQQVHQPPSEIDNLKQTSNPNYVHPDAQHADAVLRAKAIAAQIKAKQIAAGFQVFGFEQFGVWQELDDTAKENSKLVHER